jgi:hypothetical protein
MYDGDTVSILQPLDIIGSVLPHGHIVEADTQVKAYWLDTTQMGALPERLRMVRRGEGPQGRSVESGSTHAGVAIQGFPVEHSYLVCAHHCICSC